MLGGPCAGGALGVLGVVEVRHRRTNDVVLLRMEHVATLDGVDLTWRNLRGANLAGASCRGTVFQHADLEGADLSGARLQNANLRHATLWNADLSNADLSGADLSGAILLSANLTGIRSDGRTRWPDGFDPTKVRG